MDLNFKIGKKSYHFKAPDSLAQFNSAQWLQWHNAIYKKDSRMMLYQVIWGLEVQTVNLLTDKQKAEIMFVCEQFETLPLPDKWMLPVLNGLLGPIDTLANLLYGEWMFADKFCEEFLLKGDLAAGRKFLACIYRQRKGQDRGKFVEEEIYTRLTIFKNAQYATIRAVANNWIGCKLAFKNIFPMVFKSSEGKDADGKKNYGWIDVGLSIVEDNPIAFVQLEQTNLFLVLKALNNKIEKDEQMKEKQDEQKRNKR
jgi:hypothetical protein